MLWTFRSEWLDDVRIWRHIGLKLATYSIGFSQQNKPMKPSKHPSVPHLWSAPPPLELLRLPPAQLEVDLACKEP